MRRATILLTAVPLLGLPLTAASAAQATPDAASAACQAPVVAPSDATGQPLLRNVRVGRHDSEGFERVVFDLTRVPGYRAQYVRQVIQDGSGQPLSLRGKAFLTARLEPAAGPIPSRVGPPRRCGSVPGSTALKEVRSAGDFEGVVSYGLGLAERSEFRMFTLTSPNRLVIDVALPNRHPWDCRGGAVKVHFGDADAAPVAVTRRVPVSAVCAAH